MGWSGSTQYRILMGELASSDSREFERRVLPILRLAWPDAIPPPALNWLDQAGIDLMVWSDAQPFPLLVQCKGFKVLGEEIGKSQIQQCLTSIASFKQSKLKTQDFLLIHNRTNKSAEFRRDVGQALQELVDTGQAQRAQLWGYRELLDHAYDVTINGLRRAIESKQRSAQSFYSESQVCDPIEQVPFQTSNLTIDVNHLLKQSASIVKHRDPAEEILDRKGSNILVVIGEAGYGKTTASLRAVSKSNQLVLYVPAASIPKEVNSTIQSLRHCVKIGGLVEDKPPFNSELFDRIGAVAIINLFKSKETPIVLIIDGLDESIYFSRRGGLQSVFNQVRELEVPVVFTARTEFWSQRLADFTKMFGDARPQGERQHRRVRLIELLPWENDDIALLARRYRNSVPRDDERRRVDELVRIIESNSYQELYGDISRRPLFLRLVLETVSERGVQHTGRTELFYDWARAKIMRDILRPMRWGNIGRDAIISESESSDTTLRLSFRAMMKAAYKMTQIVGNSLELLPDCTINDVISSDDQLKNINDPTGLFLNSLLMPIQNTLPHSQVRIRFAHRAYQEFFLSLFIMEWFKQ